MRVKFDPVGEIMRMSGPIESKVNVNDVQIAGRYIEQKAVFNDDQTLLFLVKIIEYKEYFIKKVKFGICIINSTSNKIFLSQRDFQYLYIDSVEGNRIFYYESYHDADITKRGSIIFNMDNFDEIR